MARAFVFAVLLTASALSGTSASAETFEVQFWIRPVAGLRATFPAPSATPDVTFTTNRISFLGVDKCSRPDQASCDVARFDVGAFIASSGARHVLYSGLANPATGGPVTPRTRLTDRPTFTTCATYGEEMEIRGRHVLNQGAPIVTWVDDQLDLRVDGVDTLVAPSNGTGGTHYAGFTGVHDIDLVWVNTCSDAGLWIVF